MALQGLQEMVDRIAEIQVQIEEKASEVVNALAIDMAENMRANIIKNGSIDTGRMYNSIDIDFSNNIVGSPMPSAVVGPAAEPFSGMFFYPTAVEEGRPDIYPKSKSALRFITKDGTIVFAKHVKAAPAKPFAKPAFEETAAKATTIVLSIIQIT